MSLGLARTRDRLLLRLLNEGLSAERDLPSFLRYAGLRDSERLRVVREKALELHHAVRKWTDHIPQNLPYVDLLFAFALGKLGEATPAKKLLDDARKVMEKPIQPLNFSFQYYNEAVGVIASNFLFLAFKYRIEESLAGTRPTNQLSPILVNELNDIALKGTQTEHRLYGENNRSSNPYWDAEYIIGRLRQLSSILEPHGILHPYASVTGKTDQPRGKLVELYNIRDSNQLARGFAPY